MRTKALILFAVIIGCAYAQMPLAMMSMLGGSRAGMGGIMGGFGKLLNNPYTLCRMTESVKAVPCRSMPLLCDAQSIKNYKFPGLLKCSPMGIGCCLKDAKALAMARYLNR